MTPLIPLHLEAASTLAVVVSSNEPLLFLSEDLRVIAASASFCRIFQIDPASVHGRPLSQLGLGEWGLPQLNSLLKATAAGSADIDAYEIDLKRQGQKTLKLVVHAHRLDDGDKQRIRLLLAITDVTEARAEALQKDILIREKAVLLQEVQHRVANSLQIIASVLMQSTRNVSEETRAHLRDAHNRVMSIAVVQQQLAASGVGDVSLRAYFFQLCESLGASMINDKERLSIMVTVDDSIVGSNVSVSLGLIVTELVINSLKHAFPNQSKGRITVDYFSNDRDWILSVNDNGIGMPTGADILKPGLGTGIVEALAKQLRGEIRLTDAKPGTAVSIVHVAADHIGDALPVAV